MNHDELMKTGLHICHSNQSWDDFCFESNNGTPFNQTWFIESVSESNVKYFWYEESEIVAAILLQFKGGMVCQPPFSVHQSICFSNSLDLLPPGERSEIQYRILNSSICELTRKYGKIFFSFHPDIVDMRPFQHQNHVAPEFGIFRIEPRYTAILSLVNYRSDENSLLADIRKDRKSDYKKFIKSDIDISDDVEIEVFLELYKKTFERQTQEVSGATLQVIQSILEKMSEKRGFMLTAKLKDGTPISATVILLGKNQAFSLFTANDPEYRNFGANTALVIRALAVSKALGVNAFDFVGANSPSRSDFKLSFNSDLKRYFEAKNT